MDLTLPLNAKTPRRPIVFSIVAAVLTIGLKFAAYLLTDSAGLLSDALESGVNLLAGITAAFSVWYASRPADRNHAFGHEKIEFFSSGFEGGLVLVAGLGMTGYAIHRIAVPHPLQQLDLGVVIAVIASAINLTAAMDLIRSGRRSNSIVLVANGKHLMTDVITSVGVVAGLILVRVTGFEMLDPLMALSVGILILFTGGRLIAHSFHGLMDRALPDADQDRLRALIRAALPAGADFHALRTRQAGRRTFAEFHLLVPGRMTVTQAHEFAHRVEAAVTKELPDLATTIHIEPIEERESWETADLAMLGESSSPPAGVTP